MTGQYYLPTGFFGLGPRGHGKGGIQGLEQAILMVPFNYGRQEQRYM
jgi:hypothetical protein